METLVHYLETDKEGSRLRRSVEITRIAEFPYPYLLETVKDVVYPCSTEFDMVVKHKGVVQLTFRSRNWGVCSMRSEVILQKAPWEHLPVRKWNNHLS